jgi:hypothetical protein
MTTDYPQSDIQKHRDDIQNCVMDLKEIVGRYIEEDVLSPGEFVNCVRRSLQENSDWHKSRLELLNDAQHLLGIQTQQDPVFLRENV